MLKRKMIRDIKHNISQFIAIFLMVMLGVMVYSGINSYSDGMKETGDKFYQEYNLFDLLVIGSNFKEEDLVKIKTDKIKKIERRFLINGKVLNDKNLALNFVSENEICKLYPVEGIEFDKNNKGIYLEERFAKENNIKIGDIITIEYDDTKIKEKVVSLVNAPDYIYYTKDENELVPNRKEAGFAYLSSIHLKKPIYNQLLIDVVDINKNDEVKEEIEESIVNLLAVLKRVNNKSYAIYQGEIDEGKAYVGVFSGLFIFIAMLSVVTTMTRIVKKERTNIGTLKALGFSNFKIMLNYMNYSLFVAILGSLLGLILGYHFIGKIFINLELRYFEIPNLTPVFNFYIYKMVFLLIITVVIISLIVLRSILQENPAEALKPEKVKMTSSQSKFLKFKQYQNLSFTIKWNIRDLLRNKLRAFTGVIGVLGCCVLLVCAFGILDSLDNYIKIQFDDICNFKYKLTLKYDIQQEQLNDLKNKYGNNTSKTMMIEFLHNDKKVENTIFVISNSDINRIMDAKGKFIPLEDNGVFITYKMAEKYNYKIGDIIKWRLHKQNDYYHSKIVGFNKNPQIQNITMSDKYLEKIGVSYQPDSFYTQQYVDESKSLEGVEIIQNKEKLKDATRDVLSAMRKMVVIIVLVAILLAIVILYNLNTLSYVEKQTQFATLKVLGFTDKKIINIFIMQNNWIVILAIIFGLPMGYYLTDWFFKSSVEENYDFATFISTKTYFVVVLITYITSYSLSLFLSNKIGKIDIVSSLKGTE